MEIGVVLKRCLLLKNEKGSPDMCVIAMGEICKEYSVAKLVLACKKS